MSQQAEGCGCGCGSEEGGGYDCVMHPTVGGGVLFCGGMGFWGGQICVGTG